MPGRRSALDSLDYLGQRAFGLCGASCLYWICLQKSSPTYYYVGKPDFGGLAANIFFRKNSRRAETGGAAGVTCAFLVKATVLT